MGVVVDSSYVIDLLGGQSAAKAKAAELDQSGATIILPTIVLFEVLTGLQHAHSKTAAARFRDFAHACVIEACDEHAAQAAADIMVELLRTGHRKGGADVMIAGMAHAAGHRLISRDADFAAIAQATGLLIETYGSADNASPTGGARHRTARTRKAYMKQWTTDLTRRASGVCMHQSR